MFFVLKKKKNVHLPDLPHLHLFRPSKPHALHAHIFQQKRQGDLEEGLWHRGIVEGGTMAFWSGNIFNISYVCVI